MDFKCLMMPGLDAHITTSLCGQVNFKTLQKGLDLSSIVDLIPPNIWTLGGIKSACKDITFAKSLIIFALPKRPFLTFCTSDTQIRKQMLVPDILWYEKSILGCRLWGVGWNVKKKVWANYEQLLMAVFSTFCGQRTKQNFLKTL